MQVLDSMAADFNGFDLDASAVGMKSVSDMNIELPYTGVLPERMSPASSAHSYFNVQLALGVRIVLVVDREDGKQLRRPLKVSSDEIIALLDRFFNQRPDVTGLDEYWLGMWNAHYLEWRYIVRWLDHLRTVFSTLSAQERKRLQKYLMEKEDVK